MGAVSEASRNLLAAVAASVAELGDNTPVWVAYSGGLDSTALLAAAAAALPGRLRAVHIHHGLSPNADAWAAHCREIAAGLQVPCEVIKVRVSRDGDGLEAAARRARYGAFSRCLGAGEILLTGHHAGDQAETLGLRLARGAGLDGLAGIAPRRPLGQGWVARPFLELPRSDLQSFASEWALTWIEDESNADLRFARNYWRHRVLPAIEAIAPDFPRQTARAARHLREAATLLAQYAEADLAALAPRVERLGESIDLTALGELTPARRRAVLRHWLAHRFGLRVSEVRLELLAAGNYSPAFDWRAGDWHWRPFAGRLHALPREVLQAPLPAIESWRPAAALTLPDGSELRAAPAAAGLRADREYRIEPRRFGLRAHPAGRRHSQTLKKLLQEAGLPPWLRERAPLIFCGERLAAVADLWVESAFHTESEPALRLQWHYRSAPVGGRD